MKQPRPTFLTREQVIKAHVAQIELFGGAHGIRDEGLLESALSVPASGVGEEYLHVDLFEMSAAYLYHLAMNHPFVDGNKRTALVAADTFLRLNGFAIDLDPDDLYDLVIGVASGSITKSELGSTLREHSIPVPPAG